MKVLLINWSPVSAGTALGGGVSGYVQQLALELVDRGHEVAYLSSGQTYVPDRQGRIGPPTARRLNDFAGVQVYEIVNSPVVSPGPCQHDAPGTEICSPELEAEVLRLVGLLGVDVVHLHNIEGMSAGCLAALCHRPRGWSVVYSLHNYHTVCPQAYLLQQGRTPCRSFDSGRSCVTCLSERPSRDEKQHRARLYADRFPVAAPPPPPPPAAPLSQRLKEALATHPQPPRAAPPPPPILPPGTVVTQATVRAQIAGAPRLTSVPLYVFDPESPEWAPLENDATGEPEGSLGAGPFAARRAAMVAALNACDRVLAVSSFVERKFTALGLKPEVLRRQMIGSRMVEIAGGQPEVLDRVPRPEAPAALHLVFLGYHNYPKGLHMLLDALELLTPAHLAPIHLRVHAKDVERAAPRLDRLRARLGSLSVSGGYAYEAVPALVAGADLGVVPSVWWDNGPQTVMEFLACGVPVLGAALGGIPDLVEHGRNGLLFRGNDRFDLARTLAALPWQRARLEGLRGGVRPPLSMAAHATEVLSLYASLKAEHHRA